MKKNKKLKHEKINENIQEEKIYENIKEEQERKIDEILKEKDLKELNEESKEKQDENIENTQVLNTIELEKNLENKELNENQIQNDDNEYTRIFKSDEFNLEDLKSKESNSSEIDLEEIKRKRKYRVEDEKEEDMSGKNKKQSKKDKKNKKKHRKLKLFLKIFFIIMLVLIVAGVAGVVAIFKTDRWAITEDQLLADAGALIYDVEGNLINTLTGDEINKKVTIDEMGRIPEAFVAIEDERFYEHNGIDIKRTLHAVVDYVFSMGKGSFGGSTITQQLIKITMKDDERGGLAGIERKIREWSRAVQVEKMFNDKNKILERYLNRIYLGSSDGLEVRGVESASNYYFNKTAKELSIAQTAFLAGINHAPNSYNPFGETDNSETIRTRTLNVLAKMKELSKITEEEYNQAVEETKAGLKFEKGKVSNGNSDISFHTAAAINQIAKELSDEKDISYNEARELLINSGYSIYTTVYTGIQDIMEEHYANPKYIVSSNRFPNIKGQSAMVVINPSTGYVVGEVGALEADPDTLGLNRGLSVRQPGSSFKPLVTIAPGLENKVINASTLFYDTFSSFGTYKPHNDSDSYGGITTIRNAITHSYNVTEVKLLSILGIEKSAEFLGKIGIDVDENNYGLSMALGAPSVTPVQMAAGYAMIANGGVYITPTFYTKVVDRDGNTVIEAKQEKTRVMSEENAYIESTILQGPISSGGTASSYNGYVKNIDIGGKTGTSDGGADRWFCGFTPYYAAACWYGADNGYDVDGKGTKANFYPGIGNPASAIFFPVMRDIHKDLEAKKFVKPETIKTLTICRATGKRATSSCSDTFSEIFSPDNIPGECDGHTTAKICKETGKLATEFCTDTEEKTFGVLIDTEKNANWSPKQQVEEAPTEKCNVHTKAEEITVPNVVGKNQKDATDALTKAGFKVKVLKDNDRSKEKGIVLKQSATKAAKGAEISITVNQYDGGKNTNTNTTTPKNETTTPNTPQTPKNETTTQNKTDENTVD